MVTRCSTHICMHLEVYFRDTEKAEVLKGFFALVFTGERSNEIHPRVLREMIGEVAMLLSLIFERSWHSEQISGRNSLL